MRKLSNCPKCGEDELWLAEYHDFVVARCYYCHWESDIVPLPFADELDDEIAQLVEAGKEPAP